MYFASDLRNKLYLKLNNKEDKVVKIGKRPFQNSLPPNPKQDCIYFAGKSNVILTREEYDCYCEMITSYKLAKIKKDYPNSKGNLELQKLIYLAISFDTIDGLKARLNRRIVYLPEMLDTDTKANQELMFSLGLTSQAVNSLVEKYYIPSKEDNHAKLLEEVHSKELELENKSEENNKETLKSITKEQVIDAITGRNFLNNYTQEQQELMRESFAKAEEANKVIESNNKYVIDRDISNLELRKDMIDNLEGTDIHEAVGVLLDKESGKFTDRLNETPNEALNKLKNHTVEKGPLYFKDEFQDIKSSNKIEKEPEVSVRVNTEELKDGYTRTNITGRSIITPEPSYLLAAVDKKMPYYHATPEGTKKVIESLKDGILKEDFKVEKIDNVVIDTYDLTKDYSMLRIVDCENEVYYDVDCNVVEDSYKLGFFKEVDVPTIVVNLEESQYYPCYYEIADIDKIVNDILTGKLEEDYIALDIE